MGESDRPDTGARVDEHVATNVRAFRESLGMSQEELARRMSERGFGFTQATVWKIERGKRPVRLSEALALGEALELRLWSDLATDPETASHQAQLRGCAHAARLAYERLKAAAKSYLETQVSLAISAYEAHEAGLRVIDTGWLTTPGERAVIETRVEWEREDDAYKRIDAEVDAVLQAWRGLGVEPTLRVEDVTVEGGGPLPEWTPPTRSGSAPAN